MVEATGLLYRFNLATLTTVSNCSTLIAGFDFVCNLSPFWVVLHPVKDIFSTSAFDILSEPLLFGCGKRCNRGCAIATGVVGAIAEATACVFVYSMTSRSKVFWIKFLSPLGRLSITDDFVAGGALSKEHGPVVVGFWGSWGRDSTWKHSF
jgi:hypothetical protein